MRSGEIGGQGSTLNSLLWSSSHFWTMCVVWPLPSGNTMVMKGCTWFTTMFRYLALVKFTFTWMAVPRVSIKQNIAQNIKLPPTACCPTVHPGAITSLGKRHIRTRPSTWCIRKWTRQPSSTAPKSSSDAHVSIVGIFDDGQGSS